VALFSAQRSAAGAPGAVLVAEAEQGFRADPLAGGVATFTRQRSRDRAWLCLKIA